MRLLRSVIHQQKFQKSVLLKRLLCEGEKWEDGRMTLNQRVVRYQLSLTIARAMLGRGILTDEEYREIETIMAKRHGLSSSTIYRFSAQKQVDNRGGQR